MTRARIIRWVAAVRNSSFARNVAILSTGTAVAHALTLAVSPILTRLYDPAAFGTFGLFVSIVSIASVTACWRYDLAVVIPKRDREAANVFALGMGITVVMTLLVFIILFASRSLIAELTNNPSFVTLPVWIALSVALAGSFDLLSQWTTRRANFVPQATAQVWRATTMGVTQLVFGIARVGAGGLVVGMVAGHLVSVATLARAVWRNDYGVLRQSSLAGMRSAAVRHYRFPAYTMPQTLINAISQALPVFLLTILFSPAIAGFYWFANRVLVTPGVLIGESVRRVFYQRAAAAFNEGRALAGLLTRATLGLGAVGTLPFLLIVFFGPDLFSLVFGATWERAGLYARWLALWSLVGLMNRPTVALVPVLGLQRMFLAYEIVMVSARVAAIPVGLWLGDDVTAVAAYALVGMVFNTGLILYVTLLVRRTRSDDTQTRRVEIEPMTAEPIISSNQ